MSKQKSTEFNGLFTIIMKSEVTSGEAVGGNQACYLTGKVHIKSHRRRPVLRCHADGDKQRAFDDKPCIGDVHIYNRIVLVLSAQDTPGVVLVTFIRH